MSLGTLMPDKKLGINHKSFIEDNEYFKSNKNDVSIIIVAGSIRMVLMVHGILHFQLCQSQNMGH